MNNITERLNSLIDIKYQLKAYKLDDGRTYRAINELNGYFKRYLYGEDIIKIIIFEEFNREIHVKLYSEFPEHNQVILKSIKN